MDGMLQVGPKPEVIVAAKIALMEIIVASCGDKVKQAAVKAFTRTSNVRGIVVRNNTFTYAATDENDADPMLQIAASVKAIEEAKIAVLQIISAPCGDKVKIAAFESFATIGQVTNSLVDGNMFIRETPKAEVDIDDEDDETGTDPIT